MDTRLEHVVMVTVLTIAMAMLMPVGCQVPLR